jgi:hypothetical protein
MWRVKMKLNPVILLIVIALAVYIGLDIKNGQIKPIVNDGYKPVSTTETPNKKLGKQTGITPEYLMNYLSENEFEILPVFTGATCDIYTGKISLSDSKIEVRVDLYHERSSGEVLLVETNIDASSYIAYANQIEVEELVNEVARSYFIPLANIPYQGSEPDKAGQWVNSNILTSYADEPKDKTSTKIGPATINIFGNPLFRTLEMDFGFGE